MKSCIDYYNDFADAWADAWYKNETLLPYLKEFIKLLPQNPKVLDLCCGAGYESMRLKNLGAEVVGMDLSTKSIAIAKERNKDIKFYVQDMLKPYTYSGMFNGIVCIAGIIHIEEKELKVAFKNMHDVTLNDGYILLVVRDKKNISQTVADNGEVYARNVIAYTKEKLKEHLRGYFEFEKELQPMDDWRYYIFKKVR